jgi:hypothetical protein
MNTNDSVKKIKGIVRFTGGGALLMAIIGMIIFSPLSAGEQGARHGSVCIEAGGAGGHQFGAMNAGPRRLGNDPERGIEFFEIVLDLSDDQVEELKPILKEHHEKMAELRGDGRNHGHRAMRMKRMHRNDCCDKVDMTEERAAMRRQRRELEKDRDKMHDRMERSREELDEKLAKVLDDDQMEKYLKLRELREEHREHRRENRQERRSRKA